MPNPTDNKPIGHIDQLDGGESSADRKTTEVIIIASKDADNAHAYGQEILSSSKVVMNEKLICDFPMPKEIVSGILRRNSRRKNHTIKAENTETSQVIPIFGRQEFRQSKNTGMRIKRMIGANIIRLSNYETDL
jgi:hypothetical protein